MGEQKQAGRVARYSPFGSSAHSGIRISALGLVIAACSGGSVTPEPGQQTSGPVEAGVAASRDTAPEISPSAVTASSVESASASDVASTLTLSDTTTLRESGETSADATSLFASTSMYDDAGLGVSTWLDHTGFDAGASSTSTGPRLTGGLESTASSSETSGDAGFDGGIEPWDGPAIVAKSGFIDLDANAYVRHNVALTSSSARMFYSFHPADENPHVAPTFVFFNGGPGYATSLGLMARGTGPMTVGSPADSTALVENPWSWTQFGNLLYIDTRQAGFSYATLEDPEVEQSRLDERYENNFNDYTDSADIVRVMLRVLASTPGIQDNPIVIVGESYGGVRAAMTIEFLFNANGLRTQTWYTDPALADEVAAHFAAISDEVDGPEEQIVAQVLIQPFVAHTQFEDQADVFCAPGSPEAEVADEVGADCMNLKSYRDVYNITQAEGWSDWIDVVAGEHLMNVDSLQAILGVDPLGIDGLKASDRAGAFRFQSVYLTEAQPEFDEALGSLNPWDAYHVILNRAVYNDDKYTNPVPCVYFSMALARADAFITDGDFDVVVDTPVLPTTLMKCQERVSLPFVDSIVATHDAIGDEARPGHWTVTYNGNSPIGAGERKVRWPRYEAGHMVATDQPQQLFEDVQAFLLERGVIL